MATRVAMLALSTCLLAGVTAAASTDTHDRAPIPAQPSAPTVIVGGDQDYPPFQFLDDQGDAHGFDVELIRAALEPQGLTVRVELGEWDIALERLDRGEVDVVPMFTSPERAKRFLFTKPYMLRYHVVFGHRDSPLILSLQELSGHRVAVQHASLALEALSALPLTDVEIIQVDVEADALAAVKRGEADYALVPTGIGLYATAHGGMTDIIALGPPLLERRYVFAVRPGRAELVPIIDAGLDRVRASGERERLYEAATLGRHVTENADKSWVLAVLVLSGLCLVLLIPALSWWRSSGGVMPWPGQTNGRRDLVAWLGRRIRRRPGASFALAEIRLLGLDLIENIAGEAASQRIWRSSESRLREVSGVEHVSVLGFGNFGVVVDGVSDQAAVTRMIDRLTACLAARLEVGDLPVELRTRIGTALYPTDATDATGLTRAARIACEAAGKQITVGTYYHAGLEPDPRQLTLLSELREAIADGQLGYALQPKLDLDNHRWIGVELLVRWHHPRHGPLAPDDFIPLAEHAGMTGELTLYMVGCALKHCRQWREQGHPLTIAVNVSANDLADPALVSSVIAATGDLGSQLLLELTETDVMRDPDKVVDAIARLRPYDIRISIDDFGTGHSSLTNLRLLDADELKIDRTFVTRLLQSPSDQAIVHATIHLAHDLGVQVTAEGVEDEATLAWLADAGCDRAQGFAIAHPMSPEAFAVMLERGGTGRLPVPH
ncbi:EAL domain-containing protein [Lysobacter sp. A289]